MFRTIGNEAAGSFERVSITWAGNGNSADKQNQIDDMLSMPHFTLVKQDHSPELTGVLRIGNFKGRFNVLQWNNHFRSKTKP